jgi:uncharacterized cupredoxin-like copper-binding protein
MRTVPLLLAALLSAACSKEPAPNASPAASTAAPAAAPQDLTIKATDYAYEVPTTPIMPGLTNLTLVNDGKELHQIQVTRLTDGKTLADFEAMLKAQGPWPAWAITVGGPNVVLPGAQGTTTQVLEPGLYAIYCFIPSPDGVVHLAKGMIGSFEVQPGTAPSAPLPAGDIQMVLSDYAFTMTPAPSAGTHTFTVTNTAKQNHEAVLFRLPPGGTMEPFKAWINGGWKGMPPAAPFGGITEISPGQTINFTLDLTPGTYGIICFVPDAGDGKPHVFHGMTTTFTIS